MIIRWPQSVKSDFQPRWQHSLDTPQHQELLPVHQATVQRVQDALRSCFCCEMENLTINKDTVFKGELNLDNKWQSDYLFYIIMNEIHHRFNQFCVILKLSQFILKIYLLLNIANLA